MASDEASSQLKAPETRSHQKASAASNTATTEPAALGLALSGGGVRAALFSLGVVIGLIETGCHRRLRCVASVSGGSILNAALAHADSLAGLSSVTEFESVASKLAGSLASRGVFAFSWRTIGSALSYVIRVVAQAIIPLVIVATGFLTMLRESFGVDLTALDYSQVPWQIIGWITLAASRESCGIGRGCRPPCQGAHDGAPRQERRLLG